MFATALTLAAIVTAGAVVWRRRSRRSRAMAWRHDPVRPGLKHLATTVCDLRGGALQLPAGPGARARPRLGALLDIRHP